MLHFLSEENINLQNLTDAELLTGTKAWVEKERTALHTVLHHLYEIERRRLFSSLKYSSLFTYVTEELKYSESEAIRRISAMRLMRELPQIERKISNGDLSLTNLGLAKQVFNKKSHTKVEKLELIKKLEGKSTREAQKIVFAVVPELKRREVDYDVFSDQLREKLLRVRGKLAHKHGDLSFEKLLDVLCDQELQKLPAAAKAKREVKLRDGSCVNCGSSHALEVDHIVPKSLGGSDDPENLRLLCRSCNQRAAIRSFGVNKMNRYLKRGLNRGGFTQ